MSFRYNRVRTYCRKWSLLISCPVLPVAAVVLGVIRGSVRSMRLDGRVVKMG
jgi:hypothetical protein